MVSTNWIWLAPATTNVTETIPKVKVQDPTFEVLEAASSDGYVRARPESRWHEEESKDMRRTPL